jgi:hypothetical protein
MKPPSNQIISNVRNRILDEFGSKVTMEYFVIKKSNAGLNTYHIKIRVEGVVRLIEATHPTINGLMKILTEKILEE